MKHEFDHGVLYQGDCLDIMPGLPDKSVDMILADLPYGGFTAYEWDQVIPLNRLWPEYKRLLKRDGAVVLFSSQPFTSDVIISNRKWFKQELIWNKQKAGNILNAKSLHLKIHENICIFGQDMKYNPIMMTAAIQNMRPRNGEYSQKTKFFHNVKSGIFKTSDSHNEAERYPVSILEYDVNKGECNPLNRIHPTQKPVALFEYLIKTYTNEGETVLDNVIGSGTTAVAAFRTGRRWIGIEKDPEIYEMCLRRIQQDTQQLTIWTQNNPLAADRKGRAGMSSGETQGLFAPALPGC